MNTLESLRCWFRSWTQPKLSKGKGRLGEEADPIRRKTAVETTRNSNLHCLSAVCHSPSNHSSQRQLEEVLPASVSTIRSKRRTGNGKRVHNADPRIKAIHESSDEEIYRTIFCKDFSGIEYGCGGPSSCPQTPISCTGRTCSVASPKMSPMLSPETIQRKMQKSSPRGTARPSPPQLRTWSPAPSPSLTGGVPDISLPPVPEPLQAKLPVSFTCQGSIPEFFVDNDPTEAINQFGGKQSQPTLHKKYELNIVSSSGELRRRRISFVNGKWITEDEDYVVLEL